MNIEIRRETDIDLADIRSVTEQAFRDMPYAGGDEQDIIDRLRKADALTLSLVAILDNKVVGHIAFSPVVAGDKSEPWFALGPVSVLPEHQRRGIGALLIEQGMDEIRESDALGCILTGNPFYYGKFGFEVMPQNAPDNEPAEYFMVRLFKAILPAGKFRFHNAFYESL